jgi:hypothetical protein
LFPLSEENQTKVSADPNIIGTLPEIMAHMNQNPTNIEKGMVITRQYKKQ